MQTNFTAEQLKDPHTAEANKILRNCVHCGFCTATCPTYVLLGDELDSPRGRIYLIKNMLEKNEPATTETVKHIDRCLSCLSCMTTCPSGVNYMHLIDQARVHVEKTYRRPVLEKMLRAVLGFAMPRPRVFRLALEAAKLVRPFSKVFSRLGLKRVEAMLALVPKTPVPSENLGAPGTYPAEGEQRGRVALLMGCVQSVIEPSINAATIRLLTRLGYEVVVTGGRNLLRLAHPSHGQGGRRHLAGAAQCASLGQCAGSMRSSSPPRAAARRSRIMASCCALIPVYAARAAVVSAKAKDIVEFLSGIELPAASQALRVTYHSACSMQHGQQIGTQGRKRFCAMRASRFRIFRKAISAAARPAPTTSCSPRSPRSSGTGKSKTSRQPIRR